MESLPWKRADPGEEPGYMNCGGRNPIKIVTHYRTWEKAKQASKPKAKPSQGKSTSARIFSPKKWDSQASTIGKQIRQQQLALEAKRFLLGATLRQR
jgi:hypothetical protein